LPYLPRRAEITIARYGLRQPIEHVGFRLLGEIDQNIPAKDHVKGSERCKIGQKIKLVKFESRGFLE
jgi:hypothetical protein